MLGITDTPEVDADKRIVPPAAHGIKVISMGMLVPPDQPIIWRGPMLHGAVQQFMRDVLWGELDYLVVDLPPGTGDVALSHGPERADGGRGRGHDAARRLGLRRAQGRRHVPPAQHPAARRDREHELLRLRPLPGAHRDLRQRRRPPMAEELQIPFLGEVPIDTRVRSGGDEGSPIVAAVPDAPAAQAFEAVASQVAARSRSRTCACSGSSRPHTSPGLVLASSMLFWIRAPFFRWRTSALSASHPCGASAPRS
jgi:ATP-binding protein involved in chromosome partitioning